MPNIIDTNGLQLATRAELIAYYTAQFQAIYGADINLDPDSPDGQWMNIIVQSQLDVQDLLMQSYNMFDPDNAVGKILDQRVAINGIQRQAGTYTITPVTVVNSAAVNLYGLDGSTLTPDIRDDGRPIYTVSDNAGNRWLLLTSQLGVAPGTNVFNFRAATPGASLTVPNTITIPVTIVLGVTSINNPTTYLSLGQNEEPDAVLKIRRQKSVSLASQGYLKGLLAALENIPGVTSAFVYENLTNVTDGDGVPGHSIWVIVAGTGANADIAQAIYTKRNAGCGMFGGISYTIIQDNGVPITILWDVVVESNLFVAFTATSINGTSPPNLAAIIQQLPALFTPGVNQEVNINQVATYVQQIDPNTLVTNAGLSLANVQTLTLSAVSASGAFKILYAGNTSAFINWNDITSVIQTKVRAVPGLGAAVVTGTIAGLVLTITITVSVQGLISVVNNTLLTSGAVAVTFTFNENYSNTLPTASKKNQFLIGTNTIIILPMILSPTTVTVPNTGTQNFTPLGGYGPYLFSILVNNSGGTINSSSGAYTAGATPSVFDTVKVVDTFGHSATATVTVT